MAGEKVHDLTSLLDVVQERIDADSARQGASLTVEDLLNSIGRRAYGPLLLLIGLVSLSPITMAPGVTTVFAALTLLIAVQLLLHRDHPWMPKAALERKLPERALGKFIRMARPVTRAIDSVMRPRLTFLVEPPFVFVVALLCVLAALAIFPLSLIPILPLGPCLAITLFGLGLTARDGVLLLFGTAAMAGAFWLAHRVLF